MRSSGNWRGATGYSRSLDALIREDAAADTTAARAVLDTNVYLHFRPIGEIDWLAQLGQPAVRLLLPIAVLGEAGQPEERGADSPET